MTHKNVEILIGRLTSDEELRARFRLDPAGTLRWVQEGGLDLARVEIDALASLDIEALEGLARTLDPRLQKASLHAWGSNAPEEETR